MRAFGVIAEYNPFHSGHAYQLAQTKLAGAEQIVAVMSGSFVQRGEPAIFSPYERARAALLCGADLVIELPLPWAMARAQTFARGGVALVDALGVACGLSFGSECGSTQVLKECAELIANSNAVSQGIKARLATGMSFANAREAAVADINPDCARALGQPNDILAVEYICAIKQLGASLAPLAIRRTGAQHDSDERKNELLSAAAIRNLIACGEDYAPYLPTEAARVFEACEAVDFAQIERAVLYKMRTVTASELAPAPDVSEGIENRIIAAANDACTLEELYALAKTKRYSHARIRRIVMSAFLGVTALDAQGTPPYIRVLGFNSAGKQLLAAAKKSAGLPIVTRRSDIDALGEKARRIYALECTASDIRALCLQRAAKCGTLQSSEAVIL